MRTLIKVGTDMASGVDSCNSSYVSTRDVHFKALDWLGLCHISINLDCVIPLLGKGNEECINACSIIIKAINKQAGHLGS